MTEDQFQALTSILDKGLTDVNSTISNFRESTRLSFKDANSSLLKLAGGLGEVKGEVRAVGGTLKRQDHAINKLENKQARQDETIKTLNGKTTKDSWTRIPILNIKNPIFRKLLTALIIGLFLAVGVAAVLVLASLAGQEIVIKTPVSYALGTLELLSIG